MRVPLSPTAADRPLSTGERGAFLLQLAAAHHHARIEVVAAVGEAGVRARAYLRFLDAISDAATVEHERLRRAGV